MNCHLMVLSLPYDQDYQLLFKIHRTKSDQAKSPKKEFSAIVTSGQHDYGIAYNIMDILKRLCNSLAISIYIKRKYLYKKQQKLQ